MPRYCVASSADNPRVGTRNFVSGLTRVTEVVCLLTRTERNLELKCTLYTGPIKRFPEISSELG
jgi:hypothetical protein